MLGRGRQPTVGALLRRPVGQVGGQRGVGAGAARHPVRQARAAAGQPGRHSVQRGPAGHPDVTVDRGPDQRVREGDLPPSRRWRLAQQPLSDGLLQRGQRVGQPGQRRGVGQLAVAAEHRRGHHQRLGVHGADSQPGYHQRAQRPRRREACPGHPQQLDGQVVQQFPDVQRDAPGVLAQPLGRPARQPPRPGQRSQRGHLPGVQARQIQPNPPLGCHPHQPGREPGQPVGSGRDHAQHRVGAQPPRGEAQRQQRQLIPPLGVVHNQHQGGGSSPLAQQRQHRRPGRQRVGTATSQHRGQVSAQVNCPVSGRHLSWLRQLAQQPASQGDLRFIPRDHHGVRGRIPPRKPPPDQRRLPAARLGSQHHCAALARRGRGELPVQFGQFGQPAHERLVHRAVPPGLRRLGPRSAGPRSRSGRG